jgi:hypothetical protein
LNGTHLMARPSEDGLDDTEIRGLDAEEQRRELLKWFRTRYVAPEDHTLLINHQDWLLDEDEEQPEAFANSDEDPADALEVLTERFAGLVSDEVLNGVSVELEKTATHWFRINDVDVYREHEERDLMAPPRRPSTPADHPTSSSDPTNAILIFTPRFPNGITFADLRSRPTAIQKETMAAWFLTMHVPATGPYFGFSGPGQGSAVLNTSAPGTFAPNQGPRIAGFGQAPFFNGGRAPELLTERFRQAVSSSVIAEVADIFDGLWERRTDQPEVLSAEADIRSAILSRLDRLEAEIGKLKPEHGGLGHNGPPEDELPITLEEQATTLRAIADMRMAVSSGADYSVIDTAWNGIWDVTKRIGAWALKQTKIFVEGFVDEGGKAMGKKLPYLIPTGLGVWHFGEMIQHFVEKLMHGP